MTIHESTPFPKKLLPTAERGFAKTMKYPRCGRRPCSVRVSEIAPRILARYTSGALVADTEVGEMARKAREFTSHPERLQSRPLRGGMPFGSQQWMCEFVRSTSDHVHAV